MRERKSKYYYDTDRNKPHQSINPKMFVNKEELIQDKFKSNLLSITKEVTDLLIQKNKAYGNTALNPVKVFSKLDSTEAICARLDDKLSRIANKGINDKTEDTLDDLIGYLLLLKMSMKK